MIAEPTATAPPPLPSEQNDSIAEVNSSAAVNHSGDEAGNENSQKTVRGKKRAREGSENVKCRRAKSSRGSSGRAQGKHVAIEAVTLFEVVTMGRGAMQAVVDDWIEAYVIDRDSALLDLISFFIQCSGCKGVVTAEMLHSQKPDNDVISKMVEKLDEGSGLQYKKFLAFPWILTVTWPIDVDTGEYPLAMTGTYWRRFRSEFCEFISVLVSQSQYSVIFDSYLMDAIISLLTELSNSCIRAFRHTCTLAAVKLLSALAGVALSLSVSLENSQKLCDVEKNKTSGCRSTRLDKIQKKITELQDKRDEIENMMDTIFKGVFLKRYRDVLPEIRSMCMEELATWMKIYSNVFATDSYLKYMGWMLYDKQPDVRLKCVLGLQGLYGESALLPKLDLFTSRFKDRIISMTLDKDSEVAVQTMRLLILISKTCDDVLNSEEYKQLFQLVYSSQRPLATTAGELLYERLLLSAVSASDFQDGTSEKQTHTEQTSAQLMALLQFYQESELHRHVVYLVDSLWDCAGELFTDWPTITSLLLQDYSPQSTGLTWGEQDFVVEILVASMRQMAEGPGLPGRSGGRKVISTKEKKGQVDDSNKFTEHFFTVLPQLLSKYSGNADTLASLMKIPQYFQPEYPADENAQLLSGLLAEMEAVLELHSDPAVLEAAARSYLFLCGEETGFHILSRSARDSLVQRWTDRLTALLADAIQDYTFTADEEKTGEILATLKKLASFHNGQDLSRWSMSDLLCPLFSVHFIQDGGVPAELLVEALQCVCYSLLWNLNNSGDTLTSREKAVEQRNELRVFSERSLRCFSHSNHNVGEQAFLGLCDVLVAHNYQLHSWDPTSYGPLIFTPNPRLVRALLPFIQEHVFAGMENDSFSKTSKDSDVEKLEDLHRRRNLLAAYCKLIVHGVLEMTMAAEIFKYYMKYYNEFGDIIKETLSRTRQMDKLESARTLVLCLQQLFQRLKEEQDNGGSCSSGVQTFSSIKELARRFSLTFGWDQIKCRESIAMIHRDGIDFVFQGFVPNPVKPYPPYLSYLTILSEFSSKLLKPDKKTMYSYLQRCTGEQITMNREDYWQPLIYYRASLLAVAEGEDAVSYVSSDRQHSLVNRSRSPSMRLSSVAEGNKSPSLFSHTDTKEKKDNSIISSKVKAAMDPPSEETPNPETAEDDAQPEGPALPDKDQEDVDAVEIDL